MRKRKRCWAICLLAWLLVSIGCRTETSRTLPTNDDIENVSSAAGSVEPMDKGRIVYVSYIGGWNGELYAMNDDGSEQIRLTHHEANDYDPTWSPDGREIAFSSNRDGLTRIYIMNMNGSQIRRLTNLQGLSEGEPDWSPDGNWIVFSATTTDAHGKTTLQLANPVSGEIKELVDSEYVPQFPSWSPDSQFVWFSSSIDHDSISRSDLYTVHVASGDIQRKTHNGDDGWGFNRLVVSPNGQQVLHTPSARDPRAFILDVETLKVSRVFDSDRYKEASPEGWSPDGNAIMFFMATDDIYVDLYRLDFQSEQISQLTSDPGHEMFADWWAPQK